MPTPEPLNVYFISKKGEQPNPNYVGKQIIAYKEKTLPGKSSEIIVKVDSSSNNKSNKTFFIFNLSRKIDEKIHTILDIIKNNIECLRYNKQLIKYDKFEKLEAKLNEAGYSLHADKVYNSTPYSATDQGQTKLKRSSTISDLSEKGSIQRKGINKYATLNNLQSSSFSQRSTTSSNASTIDLDNGNSTSEDLESYSKKIHRLEEEITQVKVEAEKTITALQETNRKLQGKLEKAQTATEANEQENAVLKKQLQTASEVKDAAVQAQQTAESKVETLYKKITENRKETETLKRQFQAIIKAKDDSVQAEKIAESNVSTLQETNRELQDKLQETKQEKEALKGQFQTITKAKDDAVRTQQVAEGKVEELKNELEKVRKESTQKIVKTERLLALKTSANKEICEKSGKLKENLTQLERERADVLRQINQLNAENKALTQQIKTANETITSTTAEIENLKAQLKETVASKRPQPANEDKTNALQEAAKKEKEAEIKAENLQKELSKIIEMKNNAEKTIATLQAGLEEAKQEAAQKIKAAEEKAENLRKKLPETANAERENEVLKLKGQLEMGQKMNSKLQNELEKAMRAQKELQRQLDNAAVQKNKNDQATQTEVQNEKRDQATQAELEKSEQNTQNLQLLLKELDKHSNFLRKKGSDLATKKAGMISTLSKLLESFAVDKDNREESLGKLKKQINDSRKTLAQNRNVISWLFGHETKSAQLLSSTEKMISPSDSHQSAVVPPNAIKTTSWIGKDNETLGHTRR